MAPFQILYRSRFYLSIFAVFLFFAPSVADEVTPKGNNVYQLVTGEESKKSRSQWDAVFNTGKYVYGKEPARFLKDHIKRLPVGRALDLAMGEGRNAVFLAKKGFQVDGVDISEVALRKARRLARENKVSINTVNADLTRYQIKPSYYDVIVNIQFLHRPLVSQIKKGLKKGGVIVFENHTVDQLKNGRSVPKASLLEQGELKKLFSDFEILIYTEKNDGKNAVASLLARKR